MRRLLAVLLIIAASHVGAPVAAQEKKVKVGALKLTSSAPLFVGVEKGFFKEFGIDPELVFFQAAAPIATALAAGQIEVGATGLTAALYNIVLQGEKLWIVADKGREWPGYPLVAIIVQKELWDQGLRSVKDLYVKASRYYHDAVLIRKDGQPAPGANYDEVVRITAKHTGAKPEIIRIGFPYQDRNGRLLVEDIDKQMRWWVEHGFMKSVIPLREVVDTSFIEAAIQAVKE